MSLLTNNRDNTRTQTFTYDSLNRVITGQSTATSGDNCWGQSIPTDGTGYDRWGNLLKVNSTQCSTPGLNVATDGSNHLSGFGYDAAGNMTNDGLYTYTYNAEGQQASTSAASQTYTYDGDGRRVKKSNGRTYWFSSVTGNLLVETDGSGTVLNQYIYFGGRRVARKDGSGDVTYYFEEPVGRTRTITAANGVACNEADYYLFGGEQSHGNTCDQNYHFAGMYRDGETGNDYTQFRMYESNLGRWMSPDPLAGDITNPQSLNRYAYVLNNPTNLIDPLGLECVRTDDGFTADDGEGEMCNDISGNSPGTAGVSGQPGVIPTVPTDNPGTITDAGLDPGDYPGSGPVPSGTNTHVGPGGGGTPANTPGVKQQNPERAYQQCMSDFKATTVGKVVEFGSLLSFYDDFWGTFRNWAWVIGVKGGYFKVMELGGQSAAGAGEITTVTTAVRPIVTAAGGVAVGAATMADLNARSTCTAVANGWPVYEGKP